MERHKKKKGGRIKSSKVYGNKINGRSGSVNQKKRKTVSKSAIYTLTADRTIKSVSNKKTGNVKTTTKRTGYNLNPRYGADYVVRDETTKSKPKIGVTKTKKTTKAKYGGIIGKVRRAKSVSKTKNGRVVKSKSKTR